VSHTEQQWAAASESIQPDTSTYPAGRVVASVNKQPHRARDPRPCRASFALLGTESE